MRSLRFHARTEVATGWDGAGTGAVPVSDPAPGRIIIFEGTGTWQPGDPGRRSTGFRNAFRWSAVEKALRLEHLRFGVEKPVLLFDMGPTTDGAWREISPHQCREDSYTASLSIEGEMIEIAWTVMGPQKQESISYIYW